MNWQTFLAQISRGLCSRRGQSAIAALLLLCATAFYLWFGYDYYPVTEWLFLKYLRAWACVLLFMSSSLAVGSWLVAKILRSPPRLSERFVLAMALGVLSFYGVMFLVGVAQLYTPLAFFAVPLLLLGVFGPKLFTDLARTYRHLVPHRKHARHQPRTAIENLAIVLTIVSLVGIYLQVMLPRNAHADSHWYHFPIAEHYVAAGGIVHFPEGWYVGVYPQLASILYTWAFLLPGDLFSHVVLCQHLDFGLFLVTVAAIAVLSARLLNIRRMPAAAAVIFLFPNLFIYDSNVNGSADHILAFWAAPLAIALIRLGKAFATREAILTGLLIAAPAVTKYQGSYFVVAALILVVALAIRHRKLLPLLVILSVSGCVTSTHWLKNLIFYHDPFYPLLYKYLPSTPFHRGADAALEANYWPHQFAATGPAGKRLLAALQAAFTFSFVPNDWGWHGNRPTFGSLFTLLSPVLLLCRAPRRLVLLTLGTYVGLVVWYLTSHQDRFLQSLLPWMSAVVAGLLYLAWHRGRLLRISSSALVLAQFTSGLDVYFLRTHTMIGDSPIRETAQFIGASHEGKFKPRLVLLPNFERMGRLLDRNTVLLQHTLQSKLGIGVRIVADGTGWQGAIEYLDHETPEATQKLFRSFGVNKTVRYNDPPFAGPADAARELVYLRWVNAYTTRELILNEAKLSDVLAEPTSPMLAREPTRVAWLDCRDTRTMGLYLPRGVAENRPIARLAENPPQEELRQLLETANAIATVDGCFQADLSTLAAQSEFTRIMKAGQYTLYIRVQRHSGSENRMH